MHIYYIYMQRIHYRITSIAWHCVVGSAPVYLRELFTSTAACSGRRSLRSASSRPPEAILRFDNRHARTATRPISTVGPSVWNSLPSDLPSLLRDLSSSFYKLHNTFLFGWAWVGSASE